MKMLLNKPKILYIGKFDLRNSSLGYCFDNYPTNIMFRYGSNREIPVTHMDYCFIVDMEYVPFSSVTEVNSWDTYDIIIFGQAGFVPPDVYELVSNVSHGRLIIAPDIAPQNYSNMKDIGIILPVRYNKTISATAKGILHYNELCSRWFGTCCNIPFYTINYPVNTKYWKKFFVERSSKVSRVLLGSSNFCGWQNCYSSYMAAMRIANGEMCVATIARSYMAEGKEWDFLWDELAESYGNILHLSPGGCYESYYVGEVSKSLIAVNLYRDPSPMRFALQCAMVGTPLICASGTDASRLFPMTTVHEFDLVKAVEIGKRLVNDHSFYNSVVSYAFDEVEWWSYEASLHRFYNMLPILMEWVRS